MWQRITNSFRNREWNMVHLVLMWQVAGGGGGEGGEREDLEGQ